MKQMMILMVLIAAVFSCKTVHPDTQPEIFRINGDVFVEKGNPSPILFSPDMKEYRLYGDLAVVLSKEYNYSIVYLEGVPGDQYDPDGRIPFRVTKILKGERE